MRAEVEEIIGPEVSTVAAVGVEVPEIEEATASRR